MSSSTTEEEFDEFDEFDDDDDEPGFSGLMVLLMGGLMLGAMVAVVWVAYQHGIKMGEDRSDPPYVSADPNPVKIENADVGAGETTQREVFDRIEGEPADDVSVIAEAPEEPLARETENPLVAAAEETIGEQGDEISDRIEALAADAENAATGRGGNRNSCCRRRC